MHTVNPTPEQVDELQHMRFHHPCPAIQRRAEIVLLAAHNVAYGKISGILGICPNTVTKTLVMFIAGGVMGLSRWRISEEDDESTSFDSVMRNYWQAHPPSTVKEAAAQLTAVTGVERGLTSVRNYLKRLGFSRRKSGSVPGKANPDEQRRFVREVITPRLSAAQTNAVYFMDAAHFVFGAFLGYLWCLARVFVPTSPGRQRYNVLGAIDIVSKTMLTVTNTTYVNTTTVCEMLMKMAAVNIGKHVTIFLDNARYQHCSLVMNTARELGIDLVFLPPYSPNLNLIERFWKYVKKTCLTNRTFADFAQFRTDIDTCIDDAFKRHTEEISTLLNPKFQIIELTQSNAA